MRLKRVAQKDKWLYFSGNPFQLFCMLSVHQHKVGARNPSPPHVIDISFHLLFFSCYMGFSTNVFLHPQFFSSSSSQAFPAMVCVYVSTCRKRLLKINRKRNRESFSIFSTSGRYWELCTVWMPSSRGEITGGRLERLWGMGEIRQLGDVTKSHNFNSCLPEKTPNRKEIHLHYILNKVLLFYFNQMFVCNWNTCRQFMAGSLGDISQGMLTAG